MRFTVERESTIFPFAAMALIFGWAICAAVGVHFAANGAPLPYLIAPIVAFLVLGVAVLAVFRAFKPFFPIGGGGE